MSETLKTPATAAMCNDEWIAVRREAIRRDGRAVRGLPATTSIEIKSITPKDQLAAWDPLRLNEWGPIALPGGLNVFVSREDRDEVLAKLLAP